MMDKVPEPGDKVYKITAVTFDPAKAFRSVYRIAVVETQILLIR